MKRVIIYMVLFQMLWTGIISSKLLPLNFVNISDSISLCYAQGEDEDINATPNYFFKWSMSILGFMIIWIIFYWLIYPYLLNFYNPDYCKQLFWSMLLLYYMAWLAFLTYAIFKIGFDYNWAKWAFAFFGGIWFIWWIIILLRKEEVY